MRRVGIAALYSWVVLVPVRATQIPVGEPEFFGFEILLFHVEESVVCDEGLETLVVVSGQPVYRISSEAGTYTAQAVFIYVRFLGDVVDGGQVVVHAVSAVVGADFFQPFHAESRQTATVGGDDDVIVCSHNLEIPAVAPELADGALRTAFTEQQGRVFLVRVEVYRIDYPREHVFTVDSLCPAGFYFT